jgi:hypothetical protein
MDFHRFATLLAGAWLAGCLFMDLVATQNFRLVDGLLASPSPQLAERVQAMGGHDSARMLLRHQVSEQNRWYFQTWELAQMALGAALFLVLLSGAGRDRWMQAVTLAMFAIVLLMHFFLMPEITRLGRAFDFATGPSAGRARFWKFHGAYSASELIKLVLGVYLAVLLVRRKNPAVSGLSPVNVPGTA